MEIDGFFWPTEHDKLPRVVRYHVSTTPSEDVDYHEGLTGMTTCIVEEQPEAVEERLKRNFPLYRVAQWGRQLMGLSGEQSEV